MLEHVGGFMKRKIIILGLLGLLIISGGCTTIDPTTREVKTSNATVNAGFGAVAGALVGSLTGNSTKGALAGGVIGNSLDQEEALLREQLDSTGVLIDRCGDKIRLVIPCDITFENDSANLKSEFFDVLDSVAIVLKRFNQTLVTVAGFSSSTGSIMHNQLLSEERARCVANFLIDAGINRSRLVTVGYGLRYPIASNETKAGQSLNRRVEITIRSIRNCSKY
jgi:outer membrane protein OmpA-like peptidoglycan-associated protein